ncbi:hypothetical protein SAMN04488522_104853 [Pedobacter caeni]|uniref:Uncharacterized protein n=1 Tax=Pedobacter caeni TaxID=288992 RepID=A0A1M5HWW4_9SPHI|nr:hypothetical protein SAMN04488522_104853 [Pedobacter caeni]
MFDLIGLSNKDQLQEDDLKIYVLKVSGLFINRIIIFFICGFCCV